MPYHTGQVGRLNVEFHAMTTVRHALVLICETLCKIKPIV